MRLFGFVITLVALSVFGGCSTQEVGYRFYVLDVNEGQALVLQHGKRGLLIDTGHAGEALNVLSKLEEFGIEHLDYLILTHLHPDHASGFFRVREAFPKAVVVDNGTGLDHVRQPDISRWVAEALEQVPNRRIVKAGNVIDWQGLALHVLWPQNEPSANLNAESLVLSIRDAQNRILIMGDVGKAQESVLVSTGAMDVHEVLVAGHHGSRYTGEDMFLAKAAPRYSVISINANNLRGYPDSAVVKKLQGVSEIVFKTFEHGTVCFAWRSTSENIELC